MSIGIAKPIPIERLSVLTIPRVTVLSNPKGLPTAIAQSPTCTPAEFPKGAIGKSPPALILTTAKSVTSSAPCTLPSKVRPSFKVTVTLSAWLTT